MEDRVPVGRPKKKWGKVLRKDVESSGFYRQWMSEMRMACKSRLAAVGVTGGKMGG